METQTGCCNPVIISNQAEWNDLAASLKKQPSIAVDMESNGFHRYKERVCLIQIAANGTVALVDPLAVHDLSALGEIFADTSIEKILHSADYDIRSFDREYGFRLKNIFDTSIAAGVIGSNKLGLGNVLMEYMGMSIPKSKKLQRRDWGIRPLVSEAINYAAQDVYHLHALRNLLVEKLDELGRRPYLDREHSKLETIRYVQPVPPEKAFLSVKGVKRMTPRQKAVFREIYLFRDSEAKRLDRPPFKVFPNTAIMELAKNPNKNLFSIKGLPARQANAFRHGISKAIQRGLS